MQTLDWLQPKSQKDCINKTCILATLNPLSANSDQKQFSPNYIIQSLSRDNVTRINEMIRLEGKCHDLLSNSLK